MKKTHLKKFLALLLALFTFTAFMTSCGLKKDTQGGGTQTAQAGQTEKEESGTANEDTAKAYLESNLTDHDYEKTMSYRLCGQKNSELSFKSGFLLEAENAAALEAQLEEAYGTSDLDKAYEAAIEANNEDNREVMKDRYGEDLNIDFRSVEKVAEPTADEIAGFVDDWNGRLGTYVAKIENSIGETEDEYIANKLREIVDEYKKLEIAVSDIEDVYMVRVVYRISGDKDGDDGDVTYAVGRCKGSMVIIPGLEHKDTAG